MKIYLSYHKLVKIEKYENDSIIEVPDKCTIRALISILEIPKSRQEAVIVCVNNEPAWDSSILKEGDSVKLLPLIGGG